jgi:hypothetical protein
MRVGIPVRVWIDDEDTSDEEIIKKISKIEGVETAHEIVPNIKPRRSQETGFYRRMHGTYGEFEPVTEEDVQESFCGLCEVTSGKPAGLHTVTTFLRENPGTIRGAPGGDYVYLMRR